MAKNLIIVESPAKSKTIKKFLGSSYTVAASNGHVRDLPKSQMGVDFENDFEPKYITIRGKGELLAALRKEVKKADRIYLATDPDREGEAISWHLFHALKLDPKKTSRITFNEITKNAVRQAIKQSREIDMDLVDAQQARRVLDRVVGYQISPFLWKKIKRGLSAGRVQSVATRLVGETCSGPDGGIFHQPSALAEGKEGTQCGAGAVGSAEDHRGPGGGDRCFYTPGILDAGSCLCGEGEQKTVDRKILW